MTQFLSASSVSFFKSFPTTYATATLSRAPQACRPFLTGFHLHENISISRSSPHPMSSLQSSISHFKTTSPPSSVNPSEFSMAFCAYSYHSMCTNGLQMSICSPQKTNFPEGSGWVFCHLCIIPPPSIALHSNTKTRNGNLLFVYFQAHLLSFDSLLMLVLKK